MTDTDKTDTNFTPEFQSEDTLTSNKDTIIIPSPQSADEKIVFSASDTIKPKENKRLKSVRAILEAKPNRAGQIIFVSLLIFGLIYTALNVFTDINNSAVFGGPAVTYWLYFLLGTGLAIALGFEFVNGFHDTANAVATVIYTHSLPPHFAVIWSGVFNFLGVLFSSGAVAFGIISLLPVELIMQVGGGAGFAMVFALLIAAIIWNLGTWWLGLPASSSHTLIGSIMGVGIANALMRGRDGAAGVDWAQATKIGWSLLLSPLIGFTVAGLVLLIMKALIKKRKLFREPKGKKPPPLWIRGILIMTCTGVSFAHGSNDGQKGMGLIMLILIGTIPTTYGLNRTMPQSQTTQFIAMAEVTQRSLDKMSPTPFNGNSRAVLTDYIRTKNYSPQTLQALSGIIGEISYKVKLSGSLSNVPAASVTNVRNDMYLVSETVSRLDKSGKLAKFAKEDREKLKSFKGMVDKSTKYIPIWVKAAVAIALGLGTMVGWRRIVTTVGERIGKTHMTYAQGAAAEVTAMATIMAADVYGLPVSTTHIVSSGVAGTMAANGSGLQMGTIRNLLMAWVLTLPAAILLSGSLYWIFSHFVK
jgi:PiT family inorganic phosphate transporter